LTSKGFSGGAEVAGWLRTLRRADALHPTTVLVEVQGLGRRV